MNMERGLSSKVIQKGDNFVCGDILAFSHASPLNPKPTGVPHRSSSSTLWLQKTACILLNFQHVLLITVMLTTTLKAGKIERGVHFPLAFRLHLLLSESGPVGGKLPFWSTSPSPLASFGLREASITPYPFLAGPGRKFIVLTAPSLKPLFIQVDSSVLEKIIMRLAFSSSFGEVFIYFFERWGGSPDNSPNEPSPAI